MVNSCSYLCSEMISVTFEPQPGEICQALGNLEEISTTSAVVLMENRPALGAPISLSLKAHDFFGAISAIVYHDVLGWFVTITLDPDSTWNPKQFSPKHLLSISERPEESATGSKVQTLEPVPVTEEKVPVNFLVQGRVARIASASG